MNVSQDQLQVLNELIEDTVEHFCDGQLISGECVWTLVECLATAKVAQIKGEVL